MPEVTVRTAALRPARAAGLENRSYPALIASEVNNLVTEFLLRNRGPGYGVSVTHVADDLSQIDATVTFLSGRTYCCAEPFCHVPHDLSKFVRFAAERGVVLPAALRVHWHFVIEEGSLMECNKAVGASVASKRQEYDEVSAVRPAD